MGWGMGSDGEVRGWPGCVSGKRAGQERKVAYESFREKTTTTVTRSMLMSRGV